MTESADTIPERPSVSDGFMRGMVVTVVGWMVALSVLLAARVRFPELMEASARDMVIVAIGSLLVAAFSILPGMRLRRLTADFWGAMLAGIAIRLVGTVALFLTCRYQLASSAEWIAGMAIGWYVFLTSIEVATVGRRLSKSYPVGTVEWSRENGSPRPDLKLSTTVSVRPFETDV